MKSGFKNLLTKSMLAGGLIAAPHLVAAEPQSPAAGTTLDNSARDTTLARQVRKELVTLPFYGIFDNFAFRVDNGKVTLMGQTVRPTLRSSAEKVVKRLEGVTAVDNQIEVLPLSRFDDDVRLRVARAIYGSNALSRYGLGSQPSIRIIVKNGVVTLEGVVLNEGDRNIANIMANGVFGVFQVNNNLRLEKA